MLKCNQITKISKKNHFLATFFNLFNSTIGLGLMNAQFYFFQGGYVLSPILVVMVVLTIMYNMLLLADIANHIESTPFGCCII